MVSLTLLVLADTFLLFEAVNITRKPYDPYYQEVTYTDEGVSLLCCQMLTLDGVSCKDLTFTWSGPSIPTSYTKENLYLPSQGAREVNYTCTVSYTVNSTNVTLTEVVPFTINPGGKNQTPGYFNISAAEFFLTISAILAVFIIILVGVCSRYHKVKKKVSDMESSIMSKTTPAEVVKAPKIQTSMPEAIVIKPKPIYHPPPPQKALPDLPVSTQSDRSRYGSRLSDEQRKAQQNYQREANSSNRLGDQVSAANSVKTAKENADTAKTSNTDQKTQSHPFLMADNNMAAAPAAKERENDSGPVSRKNTIDGTGSKTLVVSTPSGIKEAVNSDYSGTYYYAIEKGGKNSSSE